MNVIQWYSNQSLTNSLGSTQVGTWDFVEMSSAGSYDVKTLEDIEENEIGKVYIFNFSSVYPNEETMFGKMPVQAAETAADFESATTYTLYTQGKTRVRYKHYIDPNGIGHFWLEYPYVYTYQFVAVPYTYGSTNYNWIESAEYDTASFSFDGVYFFSNLYNYEVYGDDVTEELLIPLCCIHPNAAPDENIFTGSKRGYSIGIINGYNIEHNAPTGNNTVRGGTGTGDYNGAMPETIDLATRNAAFSVTSANGEGLTFYAINARSLNQILEYIYGFHLFRDIDKMINACIECHILPIVYTPTSPNIARVFVANITIDCDTSHIITNRLVSGTLGTADLTNSGYDDYNDFLNTNATLYLPFVGRISIDINAISRGILKVDYVIDLFTGNIGYWVYTQGMHDTYPVLYGVYTGNCAVTVPLCGSGASGNFLGKVLNAGSSIAAGFAENKAQGVINTYNSLQQFGERVVNKAGANDVNSGCLVPYQCRLDIERKEAIRTESFAELSGLESFNTKTLGELSGFVRVISADLSGIVCEQSERDEIQRLLEQGVYIRE